MAYKEMEQKMEKWWVKLLARYAKEHKDAVNDLWNFPVLRFSTEVMKVYDLRTAIFISLIHDVCEVKKSEPDKYNYSRIDGRFWAQYTYKDLEKILDFSHGTLIRMMTVLRNDGVILIEKPESKWGDRTNWYAIDYDVLFEKVPNAKEVFENV